VAAWAVALARNGPAPDLDALAAVDVAWLVELTIQAVRAKTFGTAGRGLDAALDSELAGRIVDLIRELEIDAEVTAAER
jgi:hypothetical protein